MFLGRSFALSENRAQSQYGFTTLSDGDPSLDDLDHSRRSVVVSLEPVDPVTCRITRPPVRTAIDGNDIVAGRVGGKWPRNSNVVLHTVHSYTSHL